MLDCKIERDERKHILFLGDLFAGGEDVLLSSVEGVLEQEFYCMRCHMPKGPDDSMRHIEVMCHSVLRPDLIVAHGTAATLAAQIEGVPAVLIRPCFGTGSMIDSMIAPKERKARIALPGKNEFLTITRQMAIEYRRLEGNVSRNGIHGAHSLFLECDIDTVAYKDFIARFGSAIIVPAASESSPEAAERIATFIRALLAVEDGEG